MDKHFGDFYKEIVQISQTTGSANVLRKYIEEIYQYIMKDARTVIKDAAERGNANAVIFAASATAEFKGRIPISGIFEPQKNVRHMMSTNNIVPLMERLTNTFAPFIVSTKTENGFRIIEVAWKVPEDADPHTEENVPSNVPI